MSCLKYFLLLIFGFALYTDGAKFRCDYQYCTYSKAWFKYHQIPLTWRDARLACTLEGAILASPTTPKIRATMVKSTRGLPIFTGIHSTISKGYYYTIDGITLDEIPHKWANYEPNNVNNKEDCIALDSSGQFSDVSCDEPRPFMCYRNSTEEINECGTHDPEYGLDVRTNKCYKFHTIPRTFERAQFACSAEGGHLAIINSYNESLALYDLFYKYPTKRMIGDFWKEVAFIGFYTWGENGDWRTIHGQTLAEAGYETWAYKEPYNSTDGEFCGSIYRNGKLNDLWCGKIHAFICEKAPDFPPLCDNEPKTDNKLAVSALEENQSRRNFEQAIAMIKAAKQHPLPG